MKKNRIALIVVPLLICSLIFFACSEPDSNLNSATDVSSTKTTDTSTMETTSAAAMVQKKTSEKETTSVQSTEQKTQADVETEEADYYKDYDEELNYGGDSDFDRDYYDDIPESGNNEGETYDYNPEDPDYPQKEYKHHHTFNKLIVFEQEECGHFITVYECECGETRTEEGHGEDSEGNWLLEEVDNWIDHDELGNPMGENWTFRCPICGYEEHWGTD